MDVVKRAIGILIRIDSLGIVGAMIAIIPTARAEVESPEKRYRTVYDGKLLMMASAKTVTGIKAELEPFVGCPIEVPLLKPFPFEPVNRAKIPGENIYSQSVVGLAERIQKRQQTYVVALFRVVIS